MPSDANGLSSIPHVRPRAAAGAAGRLVFEKLSPAIGAACAGIDLSLPLAESAKEEIRAAFLAHRLLAFRDQRMDKQGLEAFARIFGALEGNVFRKPDGSTLDAVHAISNLDASGQPAENPYLKSNYHWHTDKSYLAVPSLTTMLHALELPPAGGDTEFADMTAAYAALPADMKRRIEGLRAVHSFAYMRESTGDRPLTAEEARATPPVAHPIVRTHPETGEKSLYLGMYTAQVVGMAEAAGRALLKQLLDHATQPRFVYTHVWQPGDLVLWDNRCLLHRAIANYDMGKHRRVLNRVVVKGSVPL